MHSCPIIVESMSATSSLFSRGPGGCAIASTPSQPAKAARASAGDSATLEVGGAARLDPRAQPRPRDALERGAKQPFVEPVGCYQRHDGHAVTP